MNPTFLMYFKEEIKMKAVFLDRDGTIGGTGGEFIQRNLSYLILRLMQFKG